MAGRTSFRFEKPEPARWLKAFLKALVWTYVLMIPLTWYWIQHAGMGTTANMHLSPDKILVGIVMHCALWTPLMCVWCAPVLLPLAAVVAFVGAGLHRVPAED